MPNRRKRTTAAIVEGSEGVPFEAKVSESDVVNSKGLGQSADDLRHLTEEIKCRRGKKPVVIYALLFHLKLNHRRTNDPLTSVPHAAEQRSFYTPALRFVNRVPILDPTAVRRLPVWLLLRRG